MKIVNINNGKVLFETYRNTLRGIDLRYAKLCHADLRQTNLSYIDLRHANLRGANLRGANLLHADLYCADLRDVDLLHAYLRNAGFSKTKLKGALLPHFDETPIIPNIHKAVYEAASAPNALNLNAWHTCVTTHCRAGWVVTLAGEAGKTLESKIGTDAAATLIYMKSDPSLEQIPNWCANEEEALEDMRRLAA